MPSDGMQDCIQYRAFKFYSSKTCPLVCEMSNIYFKIVSTSGFQIIWDAGLFGELNTAALGAPKREPQSLLITLTEYLDVKR